MRSTTRASWQSRVALACTLPAALLLLAFLVWPTAVGVFLAMTDATVGQDGHWIGFANYESLLTDPRAAHAFRNTAVFTTTACAIKMVLSLLLALLLEACALKGALVKGLILLPFVFPATLTAMTFWWLLDTRHSVFTYALARAHLVSGPIDYLGDPHLAMVSAILVNVWRGVPFVTICLLAALSAIPPRMIEAARVDGAGALQILWRIKMPIILPTTVSVLVFTTLQTMTDFQLLYVLTRGGPVDATLVVPLLAYQRGVVAGAVGEGIALSNALIPVSVLVAATGAWWLRKLDATGSR